MSSGAQLPISHSCTDRCFRWRRAWTSLISPSKINAPFYSNSRRTGNINAAASSTVGFAVDENHEDSLQCFSFLARGGCPNLESFEMRTPQTRLERQRFVAPARELVLHLPKLRMYSVPDSYVNIFSRSAFPLWDAQGSRAATTHDVLLQLNQIAPALRSLTLSHCYVSKMMLEAMGKFHSRGCRQIVTDIME